MAETRSLAHRSVVSSDSLAVQRCFVVAGLSVGIGGVADGIGNRVSDSSCHTCSMSIVVQCRSNIRDVCINPYFRLSRGTIVGVFL